MSEIINPPYDVIIYAGGKTGGSTLHNTFLHDWKFCRPIHLHQNKFFKDAQLIGNKPFKQTDNPKSIFDLVKEEAYFIDVYRNPIDRKISSYFQNLEHNRREFEVPNNLTIDEEVDYFQMHIFHNIENYESMSEVMKHYRVNDAMEYKGDYWIKRRDKFTFIKLKFDKISKWNQILSDIFGREIEIKNANLSSEKEYYPEYITFKKIYYEKYN
jgi:hypothetical protein